MDGYINIMRRRRIAGIRRKQGASPPEQALLLDVPVGVELLVDEAVVCLLELRVAGVHPQEDLQLLLGLHPVPQVVQQEDGVVEVPLVLVWL